MFKLIGILSVFGFSERMQRILKYGDIQNTDFTPDKELNILIYWTPSYVITYKNYKILNMVWFLAHPV